MSLWDDVHRVPGPIEDWNGVEAFDISDVMGMFAQDPVKATQQAWTDIPNIAPPFARYFMFGRTPNEVSYGPSLACRLDGPESSVGCLFLAEKSQAGWVVNAVPCAGSSAVKVAWSMAKIEYNVDADGVGRDANCMFHWSIIADPGKLLPIQEYYMLTMYVFAIATSVMHCKNVTARRVHPPEKLANAAAKRGRPIYSYSVLDVKPVRRVLDDEGGMSQGASLAKALHVCRGHFKDYRDGAGLFGKVKGLYWWEQSLRGNVAAGVHVKDYRVKT